MLTSINFSLAKKFNLNVDHVAQECLKTLYEQHGSIVSTLVHNCMNIMSAALLKNGLVSFDAFKSTKAVLYVAILVLHQPEVVGIKSVLNTKVEESISNKLFGSRYGDGDTNTLETKLDIRDEDGHPVEPASGTAVKIIYADILTLLEAELNPELKSVLQNVAVEVAAPYVLFQLKGAYKKMMLDTIAGSLTERLTDPLCEDNYCEDTELDMEGLKLRILELVLQHSEVKPLMLSVSRYSVTKESMRVKLMQYASKAA